MQDEAIPQLHNISRTDTKIQELPALMSPDEESDGEVTLHLIPGQALLAAYPIAKPRLAPVNVLLPASDQYRDCF